MTTPTIVVPTGMNATLGLDRRLREAGYRVRVTPPEPRDSWSQHEIDTLFADADVILASPYHRFSGEVIRAATHLRLIGSPVIGFDHIDVDAATRLAVLVSNCPTEEIIVGMAESTVMLMVALLLQLERKQAQLRSGVWLGPHNGRLLRGRTIGLVGLGRIGRAVVTRLQGWDVTVQAYDPYVAGTEPLASVLATADVVSIHTPRTPETIGLIGARELALMKADAVLVNTARGGIVDEAALADAIDAGRIAGAAVDAWADEPPARDNPLFRCDPERVILTPHNVGHNVEIGPAGVEMSFRTILRALEGELPESVVNPEVVQRWKERLANA